MSQKVAITGAKMTGHAYLGDQIQPDETIIPVWSADPGATINWLCDAYRTRFNQHRSTRSKYVYDDDKNRVLDSDGKPALVPIGSSVTDVTDQECRTQFTYLAAVPAMILQAPTKTEATEWFAAAKRRKTLRGKGRAGGAMPQFVSRKHTDQKFVCWFNGATNAVYLRTGKRSGLVTITGKNPVGAKGGYPAKWKVQIRVRVSQPVRAYTSILVNWTMRELVFVNATLPVTGRTAHGDMVGLDVGVVHTIADSDGQFYDQPNTTAIEIKRAWHQKRMAKSRQIALKEGRNFWESHRYQQHKTAAAGHAAKRARVRLDFQHKVSTDLVRRYDFIAVEDLHLAAMTRRAHGKGAAQKRGLNRVLAAAALAQLATLIEVKAKRAGVGFIRVPAAYTSQRCNPCRHTAAGNRESQAVFKCLKCGHTDNADTNGAKNVIDDAITIIVGQDIGPAGSGCKTAEASAPTATCAEPPTKHPGLARI